MEFVFRLSNYDASGLKEETARILQQRVEAHSRQTLPKVWKMTDKLNSRKKATPEEQARHRKLRRVYGIFLLLLSVIALVPGLMEPRIPSLIGAGAGALVVALAELWLSRERKPPAPPLYCRQMAEKLLAGRQAVDWNSVRGEVRFDESGITLSTGKERETASYQELTGVFETERLWLVIDEKNTALLLQKKDLVSGEAETFLPYLQGKIIK